MTMKPQQRAALLEALAIRFENNMQRHAGLAWARVQARLAANPGAIATLQAMEVSGGEPDVVGSADKAGRITFVDCAPQSPAGRRSLCFDDPALEARKEHKPKASALATAASIGIELLTEEQYRALQTFGEFDTKTSSWIATPPEVRAQGGALFCDRRYGKVFVYHNGAESYYAARGFRGSLVV